MSAILSLDPQGPSEGGGATYLVFPHARHASPVALSFLHTVSGPRIEDPLSLGFREELVRRYGAPGGAHLHSLLAEQDPELFFHGLLQFAARQEKGGREAEAIPIYQFLSLAQAPGDLSGRARRRLEVLSGTGSLGDRAEFLLSHFAKQATEPAPLLAMGAASLAYRAVRGSGLAKLLAQSSGVWTRGMGARALAATGGFGAEVLAFSGGMRAAHEVLGRPVEEAPLGRELAHGALFLGAIKSFGATGQFLQKTWRTGPRSSLALQQALLFSGIHSVPFLETATGLRESPGGDTAWVDSLALLLGLQVSARLSRSLLGSRFTAWEGELEFRSSNLLRQRRSSGGPELPAGLLAASVVGAKAGDFQDLAARNVHMSSGSKQGDNSNPPSRPSSSFPPRSSDFFVKNAPGIVKIKHPPPHLGKIINLLLLHRSLPEALTNASRELDWLMPEDRVDLVSHALEIGGPEVLIQRLTDMATQVGNRSAAVHALRLLLILQSGTHLVPSGLTTSALNAVGEAVSPDPKKSGILQWKVAETRLARELDAIFSSDLAEGRRHALVFEMELSRLTRGGFSRPFFDDLLAFSLELKSPKSRHLAASSAVSMAMGSPGQQGPLREFMTGYYAVSRLAQSGHLTQAMATSQLTLLRSLSWEQSAFPKSYTDYLRGRLKFQRQVVQLYSEVLKDPQAKLQDYYQVHAENGRYDLPETWGVIWTLREHAALLQAQQGHLTMNAMLRLQAAQSLFRDMVLEPYVGKAFKAVPELAASRSQLLDLIEELPPRTRVESQEPLQAIFNALASRQEWREAYHLLDAVYHLQLADPSFMRSVHASLLVSLDIAQHRALGTPLYEAIASQVKRFSDFESRFF